MKRAGDQVNVASMGCIPALHAAERPDAPAVVHDEDALSWAALSEHISRIAWSLQMDEIQPGDVVCVILPNSNRFIATVFAIWLTGGIPFPLSPNLQASERRALLALAQPRLVIDESWHEQRTDAATDEPFPAAEPTLIWKAMASGGSTGAPKLILAHRPATTDPTVYELFPWEHHQGRLGKPYGVMLNPGPLYHNGPFVHVFMNLFVGSTLIGMTRFDAEDWLRLVARHHVSFSYLVPTMMHRIWALPESVRNQYDLSSLQGIIHTAAPCPPWLKRAWIDWLGPERVWEAYGSTEAVASSLISGDQWLARPGSVGRFYFAAEGRVLDDAGAPQPPGEAGMLWVRAAAGREPVYSYIGAEPQNQDGWHSFGDLASMDEDGYLYILDRRTDLIIRGGNNVYPAEVEAAIESHPDVIAAAVIGLPDADLGAKVHAIVQPHPGKKPDLAGFLADRLTPYKRPTGFEYVTGPLRDAAGKVKRSKLREERLGDEIED